VVDVLEALMVEVSKTASIVASGQPVPSEIPQSVKDYIDRFPKSFKKLVDSHKKLLDSEYSPMT